jgi:glucokinase
MARLAIGVDFGGTKVLAAVVEVNSGKVVGTGKKKTSANDGPNELMKRIFATCDAAMSDAGVTIKEISGIGVGIAGQVDAERGLLIGTANLSRSVVDLPMKKRIEDKYGVPAEIRNDVQIAAVGEASFGAGKGIDEFVCVFVGTGIGGAIIQHGELVKGYTGNAGELGHTTVDIEGRICGCGGRGHLEAYASRTAITAALLGELRRGHSSVLSKLLPDVDPAAPGGTAIRSGVLKKAVESGDEVAVQIVTSAATYLGYGLASIVNFQNPQRIILGGGVIEALDMLFETAEAVTRREAFPAAGEKVEIVRAALGDNSGVVGAAVIAAGAQAA